MFYKTCIHYFHLISYKNQSMTNRAIKYNSKSVYFHFSQLKYFGLSFIRGQLEIILSFGCFFISKRNFLFLSRGIPLSNMYLFPLNENTNFKVISFIKVCEKSLYKLPFLCRFSSLNVNNCCVRRFAG